MQLNENQLKHSLLMFNQMKTSCYANDLSNKYLFSIRKSIKKLSETFASSNSIDVFIYYIKEKMISLCIFNAVER